MQFIEVAALVVIAAVALLAAIYTRRHLLRRSGGTVEMSVRLTTRGRGWGWAFGVGRFSGDELQWFRIFSLWPRPKRLFLRPSMEILRRRSPSGPETLALPPGAIVLVCSDRGSRIEVALADGALTGFLSWLEAAAPGAPFLSDRAAS
ncbi:DUF2550 domain-containing protein [Fodinicola feengrottensis]|uniref:DUF2550 domain-containing protein n=1 Tax=Fodinicola feengrottensis TaxID=435914 RepID=A0ABP4RQK5_9ACTN